MAEWKLAAVQMDCRYADRPANLKRMRNRLREAAGAGARLVVFPECALTGYCYPDLASAAAQAEPLPGPASEALATDCLTLGVHAVFGLLERDSEGRIFNSCALVGPGGLVASYRKIHLPCLGVDHHTTPGDRPFAVHDIGGLRVGMNICYDGSFPESSRVMTLLGADLIVLPTNWPTGAFGTMRYLTPARALENHVFYLACNRVGDEGSFHFIGCSRVIGCDGAVIAASEDDADCIVYAVIDPARARHKQIVNVPGVYEVNRVGHRRPEMYGPLVESDFAGRCGRRPAPQ